jgi:hypothetical protein
MGCRFSILLLVFSVFGAPASAQNSTHVRTSDPRMRRAIHDGVSRSTLFRDLVAQLDASDVIVYVEAEFLLPQHLQGRLTWLSAVGGQRYVRVGIACALAGPQQIAILAHELQHATEIASAEGVIDEVSLAEEYRRIGFASAGVNGSAGYDSRAAIDAGRRVWQELSSVAKPPHQVASADE